MARVNSQQKVSNWLWVGAAFAGVMLIFPSLWSRALKVLGVTKTVADAQIKANEDSFRQAVKDNPLNDRFGHPLIDSDYVRDARAVYDALGYAAGWGGSGSTAPWQNWWNEDEDAVYDALDKHTKYTFPLVSLAYYNLSGGRKLKDDLFDLFSPSELKPLEPLWL